MRSCKEVGCLGVHYAKGRCKSHYRKHTKQSLRWRAKNKQKWNALCKRGRDKLRRLVIEKLGGKCVCCGETTFEFLTVDHVNGGGTKHRQSILSKGNQGVLRAVRDAGFPKDRFQVLCYNCNCAKGAYGVCPHQLVKVKS